MVSLIDRIVERIRRETFEESLWYLVGALGDGTMYHDDGKYVIEYGQKDVSWLKYSIGLRLEKLGAKPHLVKHKTYYWKIKTYNKALYYELSSRWKALHMTLPVERNHVVKFIRGLFDAEGTISKQDRQRVYVRISQKDKKLLESVAEMLYKLDIKTTRVFVSDKHGTYALQVSNSYVKKFVEIVGTDHPLKYQKIHSLNLYPQSPFF